MLQRQIKNGPLRESSCRMAHLVAVDGNHDESIKSQKCFFKKHLICEFRIPHLSPTSLRVNVRGNQLIVSGTQVVVDSKCTTRKRLMPFTKIQELDSYNSKLSAHLRGDNLIILLKKRADRKRTVPILDGNSHPLVNNYWDVRKVVSPYQEVA